MKIDKKYQQSCGNIASCVENGRKFTLENAKDFFKIHLEALNVSVKHCDYYFYKEGEIEIFVELKGANTEDAFEQLESSLNTYSQNFKNKYAFVIAKNSLPRTNTILQKYEKKMKAKGVSFKQKTDQLICKYESEKQKISIQ